MERSVFRVGDLVALPPEQGGVVATVRRVDDVGHGAAITVEYPAGDGSSDTLVKVYRPGRLTRATEPNTD